jgi:cyclic beta-1,2-glucan synthetase
MKTVPRSLQIHSNGRMRSLVLPDGSGGLFRDWVALTRFSEASPQASGPHIYLREGGRWGLASDSNVFTDLSRSAEIAVLADADVEVRKITLTNQSQHTRHIELTSYTEISLNHPMGDAGHPAFSKLFVQTSLAANERVLIARRRPRGLNENWPWMAQSLIADSTEISWETNRASFIGRGRSPLDPAAMDLTGPLSGNTGNVLDPVMAWRCSMAFTPGESKTLYWITAAADDEKSVLETIRTCTCADTLNLIEFKTPTAELHERLAAEMLLGRQNREVPNSPAGAEILHRFPRSNDELHVVATAAWSSPGTQAFVNALPIWRSQGLQVKLHLMGTDVPEVLPEAVDQVDPTTFSPAEMEWYLASAQWVVGEELNRSASSEIPPRVPADPLPPDEVADAGEPLLHFNGHGGFSADGREYVIPLSLEAGRLKLPPMPWVNVLANPNFGCIISERGAGYSWARNSQANRLTPWSNDPIRDPHGEAIYLVDEDSKQCWSPLPGPCAPQCSFVVRHGFGRSRFISKLHEISQCVECIVPPSDPVKLLRLRLTNHGAQTRKLRFATYHALVLGSAPDRHHASLAWTSNSGIQHAFNPRAGDFSGGRVFSVVTAHGASLEAETSFHSSQAFLGNGGIAAPSALLDDQAADCPRGFGRDACFARSFQFELPPSAELEICVIFGEAMSEAEENRLIAHYTQASAMQDASTASSEFWEGMLNHVRVQTPLPEVDLMVNGWLLYQNLACRIWGRSAFYQSGGAYGFRDQLQDSGALAAIHPQCMRDQILLHAAQQFPEGDVTHWWHPEPMNRGMRTKFSDDLLWLPYLTDHYVQVTGDHSVFEEIRPFIEGPLLGPDEDEEYMKPEISHRSASVFEHCCLAIDRSLTQGEHGLPLIGIGDWNDGMSRIGREGRGESVWMGFFLFTILNRWIPLCEKRGEAMRAEVYTAYREALLAAINDAGWDGEWYRRAYYDDGTPLGTHTDDECRIDALAQAWAVISKAAPPERVEKSLDALQRELIDEDHGIIRLLHPPFVNTPHDPGYIKGYVAGVRENGGQYTHAACWVIRAMAEAGRRDDAARLLQRLSPVWQSRNPDAVQIYQVEPYVVAADIYGAAPHIGRGGWTWYTGSAGWMFRVALESVLGFRVENGKSLVLDPKVPDSWPGFSIDFKTISGQTNYHIKVSIPEGKAAQVIHILLDGRALPPENGVARWPMLDDGKDHELHITLGA